uniref:Dynein regulatory complex subunit 4 n=1 Tax=Monopterus albus TaxID=43700 RepID=A0A3Q3J274_MONAL
MAPKLKGKSKAPKAPTVPVSLTKGTSSNDIERLQQELDKVQKERDQFKLEKQQIQVERDKIFSLWKIAEERVAKAKDQISALDSDMLQNHWRYLKELHVSKQTAEYFRIEFQKAASELKAGGSVSTEEEETIMSKPDQLRIEIRAMNLEREHDRQLDELSNHLEKHVSVQDSMKEKEDVCVKHLTQLQQDLGNMTNNGIIKLEEQWSRDINDLKEDYKKAVNKCLNRNATLVKENNAMKEQLKEDNNKKAEALLVQHKNLTDHLSKINKKLGVFAEKCAKISMVSDKLLNKRKRQLGRDQLSLDSFMASVEEIQAPHEADLKSLS